MRLAVIGSGAVGQFYGAQLVLSGYPVTFLARRDAAVLREQGLRIHQVPTNQVASSQATPLIHRAVTVATRAEDIGPVDGVIVALKTTGLDSLEHLLPPLLGPTTWVTVLCNGLGVEEQVARWCPAERVFGQLCFVCINRDADGTVRHLAHGAMAVGSLTGQPTDVIAGLWTTAGVRCHQPPSLLEARWRKLVWNIPFNGLATQHDVTTDVLLEHHLPSVRALMMETIAIANADLAAAGRAERIEPTYADDQIARTREMGAYAPSTLLDARAGLPLESAVLFVEPFRRAQRHDVSAPHLAKLVTALG